MASITERNHPSGRTTWRVVLRRKGIRAFSITFDELSEACDWIEKNEKLFYKNPDKYFTWKQEIAWKMQRDRQKVNKHLVRPKFNYRSV